MVSTTSKTAWEELNFANQHVNLEADLLPMNPSDESILTQSLAEDPAKLCPAPDS